MAKFAVSAAPGGLLPTPPLQLAPDQTPPPPAFQLTVAASLTPGKIVAATNPATVPNAARRNAAVEPIRIVSSRAETRTPLHPNGHVATDDAARRERAARNGSRSFF